MWFGRSCALSVLPAEPTAVAHQVVSCVTLRLGVQAKIRGTQFATRARALDHITCRFTGWAKKTASGAVPDADVETVRLADKKDREAAASCPALWGGFTVEERTC